MAVPGAAETDMSSSAAQHPVTVSQDTDLDLEALQLHQVLLQSYQDNTAASNEGWQPVVRQEDGQSDSSGETIPSDSGRGGSEEDISHGGHVGAGLNDDCRLAALHDASFQSSNTFPGPGNHIHLHPLSNPNKSSVRDPIRTSSRKHVTFKDLAAGKRGLQPLGNSGPGPSTSAGSGSGVDSSRREVSNGNPRSLSGSGSDSSQNGSAHPRSLVGAGSDSSHYGSSPSPRYTQLPNRDTARSVSYGFGASGNGDTPRNVPLQQETRDPPRSLSSVGKGGSLSSPRSLQDTSSTTPTYVNEPYGNLQGPPPLSSPSSSSSPKDWSRSPGLFQRDGTKSDSVGRSQGPRGGFSNSQEMQTFFPAPRVGGSREHRPCQQNSKTSTESPTASWHDLAKHSRDCHNDSLATTDDCDDQRSTTTSGSYTIDNEDTYVGVELNHAPWKDVVV